MEGHTTVCVRGPLPADIASTILKLIGEAYPSTKVQTAGPGDALNLLIPKNERPVHPDSPSAGEPMELYRLDVNGASFSTSLELGATMTRVMEESFAEFDAENYVEMKLSVPTSEGGTHHYAMIFARTEGQSPHELRQKAERRAEAAESEVERLKEELAKLRG